MYKLSKVHLHQHTIPYPRQSMPLTAIDISGHSGRLIAMQNSTQATATTMHRPENTSRMFVLEIRLAMS